MTKQHVWTTPDSLRVLVEQKGTAKAGELLGVAPSLISKALAENKVRRVNELAARALVEDRPAPEAPHLLLVRVHTKEDRQFIQSLCKRSGLRCIEVAE